MAHVDLARPTGLEKDEPRAVGCGFFCGRTHAGVIRGGRGRKKWVGCCVPRPFGAALLGWRAVLERGGACTMRRIT